MLACSVRGSEHSWNCRRIMLHLGWSLGVCGNRIASLYTTNNMATASEPSTNNSRTVGAAHESSDTDSTDEKPRKRLRPLSCLEPGVKISLALIVLNQPLEHQYPHLIQLWNRSTIRAAADGASNHLHDLMVTREGTDFVPDLLTGDFDSARPEVLEFMKEKGAKLVETEDQNFTDFTKCLRIVDRTLEHNKLHVDCMVALGAIGGRFDHTLSTINTLYDVSRTVQYPIYLIGDDNLACLLRPGDYSIEIDTGLEEGWCALIPVGGKCTAITTTGLKYNLDNQSMEFGGLISTSNHFDPEAREVTVSTDSPVVWAMGIKRLKLKAK